MTMTMTQQQQQQQTMRIPKDNKFAIQCFVLTEEINLRRETKNNKKNTKKKQIENSRKIEKKK